MKKEISNHFSIQFIFVLLLFLIIAVLSVMIIFLGKDIYNKINDDRNMNYDIRVSLSYIANKVRQADKDDTIYMSELNGDPALVIKETYDGSSYETWIYHYDKYLYEIFIDEGSPFEPADGTEILEIDKFTISELQDNTFKFSAESKGNTADIIISMYSKQVVIEHEE